MKSPKKKLKKTVIQRKLELAAKDLSQGKITKFFSVTQADTESRPFSRARKIVKSSIGQSADSCSGVAVASVEKFTIYPEEPSEINKQRIAKELQEKGKLYYELGKENDQLNMPHIEVSHIFHTRNENMENVLKIDEQLSIIFDSADTVEFNPSSHISYAAGFSSQHFMEAIENLNYAGKENFILGTGQHFISVIRMGQQLLLVNGLPTFQFMLYNDFNALILDLSAHVRDKIWNIHVLRFVTTKIPTPPNQKSIPVNDDAIVILSSDDEVENPIKTAIKTAKNPESFTTTTPIDDIEYCDVIESLESSDEDADEIDAEEDADTERLIEILRIKEPRYSKISATRGECQWGNCRSESNSTRNWLCRDHDKIIRKHQLDCAMKMRIPCSMNDCDKYVLFDKQFCSSHHNHTYTADEIAPKSIEQKKEEIRHAIRKFVVPLVSANIPVYIGKTRSIRVRLNRHIEDLKKEGHNVAHIQMIELIKVKGLDEANIMEKLFIYECTFNENSKIRKMILNREGGGDNVGKKYGKYCDYSIYLRFDGMSSILYKDFPYEQATLSIEILEEVMENSIRDKNILSMLDHDTNVVFGFTCFGDTFRTRMWNYNKGEMDRDGFQAVIIPTKDYKNHIIIRAGDKVQLKSGLSVIITHADIVRLEMVATYLLEFGALKIYKDKLHNVRGGGRFRDQSGNGVIYYRLFKRVEIQEQLEVKKCKQTVPDELIPYKDGKILWNDLLCTWRMALLEKVLLKKPKEKILECVCGKKFASKDTLQKHKKICVQAGGTPKVFHCPVPTCEQTFSAKQNLKRHMKRIHEKLSLDRRVVCNNKKAIEKNMMKRKIQNEKP